MIQSRSYKRYIRAHGLNKYDIIILKIAFGYRQAGIERRSI